MLKKEDITDPDRSLLLTRIFGACFNCVRFTEYHRLRPGDSLLRTPAVIEPPLAITGGNPTFDKIEYCVNKDCALWDVRMAALEYHFGKDFIVK